MQNSMRQVHTGEAVIVPVKILIVGLVLIASNLCLTVWWHNNRSTPTTSGMQPLVPTTAARFTVNQSCLAFGLLLQRHLTIGGPCHNVTVIAGAAKLTT
jgi:hypothetical protein